MKERFEGLEGRRVLLDVLTQQKLVNGNIALAQALAAIATLREIEPQQILIEQNSDDRDVFFIVAGGFKILVNGREVGTRRDREHVGEMAALEPSQPRSATVVAFERSVVARLSEPQFSALADQFPWMWRMVAKELSRRLMQRNALVTAKRDKIGVFIMSSVEALPIARALQSAFEHDPFDVVVWTDGVFRASNYAIESLELQLDRSDFGIAIAAADDATVSREQWHLTPRDNVTFELGLFMGRLGRKHSLLLEPRGEHVKLPSDLAGLITLSYEWRPGRDGAATIASTANKLRDIFLDLGPVPS